MTDENLTPYERTYGAPLNKQAGTQPAPAEPAPPPATSAPAPAAAPKRKAWPWVVLACAVALVLLVGGCASCAVIGTIAALDDYPNRHMYDPDDPRDELFGGFDGDEGFSYDELDQPYRGETFTYDEIEEYLDVAPGAPRDGACREGLYSVGQDADIAPGLYYMEGSQDAVGEYFVFSLAAHPSGEDLYRLEDAIVYVGNYFADLEEGELIAFLPGKPGETMRPADKKPLGVEEPYQSGCYRVGIDIPAGTYVVTLDAKAAAVVAETAAAPAAIVMNDLDFDYGRGSDSIDDEVEVIAGGKKTVTVKDGQYLELIGTQATLKA